MESNKRGGKMKQIVKEPLRAISEAKKHKDMKKTLLALGYGGLMLAVGSLFWAKTLLKEDIAGALSLLLVFWLGFALLGFLVHFAMKVMKGKSDYYSGLTPLAFMALITGFGVLVASVLNLIPYFGVILMTLVLLATFVLANTVFLKAMLEFYETDLLTVLVVMLIIYLAIVMAISGSLLTTLMRYAPLLGNFRLTPMW